MYTESIIYLTIALFLLFAMAVTLIPPFIRKRRQPKPVPKAIDIPKQDELEKKYLLQLVDDLRKMDSESRLYGTKLLDAIRELFRRYNVVFPLSPDIIENEYYYIQAAFITSIKYNGGIKAFLSKFTLEDILFGRYNTRFLKYPNILFVSTPLLQGKLQRKRRFCKYSDGTECSLEEMAHLKESETFSCDYCDDGRLDDPYERPQSIWLMMLVIKLTTRELASQGISYQKNRILSADSWGKCNNVKKTDPTYYKNFLLTTDDCYVTP